MDLKQDIDVKKIFGQLFRKRSVDAAVGVDIGSAFIKAVELRKKSGKATLMTYGEIALGPLAGLEVGQATSLSTQKIGEALQDLFTEAKVSSRDIVFSIPLSSTLLTVIELPDVGQSQLKEMIPLEARKYIPTPITEVSLSHWVIPKTVRTYIDPDEQERQKNAPSTVDVLLAAVHNDVLAKYNDIAAKAGATSVAFEIEVFATIRAVLGRDPATTMIVDIGTATTKVVIVEEGIVRSAHLIGSGTQGVTLAIARAKGISFLEAEELKRQNGLHVNEGDPALSEVTRLSMERVFGEVSRILAKYQHQKRITISRVIFTGGGSLLKGIIELAQNSFGGTVAYGNAFERVDAPPVLADLLKEAGPEFAVAVGLAERKI